MPESFDKLRGPNGLSSMEILWVWLGVRIKREKVETSLSASERGRAGPLGLILVISPWLCSTRGGLEPFAGQPSNLSRLDSQVGVERLEPPSPIGLGKG